MHGNKYGIHNKEKEKEKKKTTFIQIPDAWYHYGVQAVGIS